MTIEGMCIACHGPLTRHGDRVTAVTCTGDGGNCHQIAYSVFVRGRRLPWKYEAIRHMHRYRRELLAVEARLLAVVEQGGAVAA